MVHLPVKPACVWEMSHMTKRHWHYPSELTNFELVILETAYALC